MNIPGIIKELKKLSSDILSLNEPVDEETISNFEVKYNITLPSDYKLLIRSHNGIGLCGVNIYGIEETDSRYSLEECYLFEHHEVDNEMPLYLIPFSPDGGGNHYCFDTRMNNDNNCLIVFWQHDYPYNEENPPEEVNTNLADWIKEEMIDWALEDYDYDGTEK